MWAWTPALLLLEVKLNYMNISIYIYVCMYVCVYYAYVIIHPFINTHAQLFFFEWLKSLCIPSHTCPNTRVLVLMKMRPPVANAKDILFALVGLLTTKLLFHAQYRYFKLSHQAIPTSPPHLPTLSTVSRQYSRYAVGVSQSLSLLHAKRLWKRMIKGLLCAPYSTGF